MLHTTKVCAFAYTGVCRGHLAYFFFGPPIVAAAISRTDAGKWVSGKVHSTDGSSRPTLHSVSARYRYTYSLYFFLFGGFELSLYRWLIGALFMLLFQYQSGREVWAYIGHNYICHNYICHKVWAISHDSHNSTISDGHNVIAGWDLPMAVFWVAWLLDELEEFIKTSLKWEYFADVQNWPDISLHILLSMVMVLKAMMVASAENNDSVRHNP